MNLNSSIQSRTAELLSYLENSEVKVNPKKEKIEYHSQAEILNYKLELDEAMKTIEMLKFVIQKQKKEAAEADEDNKKNLEKALDKQRVEYEEIGLKNMSFIEQLLIEKQQRISQLAELNNKIKEIDGKHQKTLQDFKDQAQKELKRQKEA